MSCFEYIDCNAVVMKPIFKKLISFQADGSTFIDLVLSTDGIGGGHLINFVCGNEYSCSVGINRAASRDRKSLREGNPARENKGK
jgi:hypothetical protein